MTMRIIYQSAHRIRSDNTPDFTHSENTFKEHVRQFAAEVKSSISDMTNHMQQRLRDLDRHVQRLESLVLQNSRNMISRDRMTFLAGANENGNNCNSFLQVQLQPIIQ